MYKPCTTCEHCKTMKGVQLCSSPEVLKLWMLPPPVILVLLEEDNCNFYKEKVDAQA